MGRDNLPSLQLESSCTWRSVKRSNAAPWYTAGEHVALSAHRRQRTIRPAAAAAGAWTRPRVLSRGRSVRRNCRRI